MSDLTVIFITANEVPDKWVEFHRKHLDIATEGHEILTIGRTNGDLIDTEPKSYGNIYRQLLRGAKHSSTKYVAMAEDDTLYSKEHFNCFRPKDDEFAYNRSRWSLFTWLPIYSLRNRISNCSLVAPRELLIEALEERFSKKIHEGLMGECGRNSIERQMGITLRKMVEFYSEVPIVQLSHPKGSEDRQRRKWKKLAQIKATDIPYWGKAEEIIKNYE